MKYFLSILFLLFLSSLSYAAKNKAIANEQCRAASNEIIKISEEPWVLAKVKRMWLN